MQMIGFVVCETLGISWDCCIFVSYSYYNLLFFSYQVQVLNDSFRMNML